MTAGDRSGEFGQIYLPALRRARDLWLELEPLVVETAYDDPIDPASVRLTLSDGLLDADGARLDVQWSVRDNYSFHYVDSEETNWRFDRHPNPHSPRAHFHPPQQTEATTAEPSCITVEEVSLVTRAVHKMWRLAYEYENLDHLNSLSNPP